MPFKVLGNGRYQGPSGKTFNKKQVGLYYANGGKFPGQKGAPALKTAIRKKKKKKLFAQARPKVPPVQGLATGSFDAQGGL